MILFHVKLGNAIVITWARSREVAKSQAMAWLGNDPEKYVVTPLTSEGDRVRLNITLFA